jgi:hypothetical protein
MKVCNQKKFHGDTTVMYLFMANGGYGLVIDSHDADGQMVAFAPYVVNKMKRLGTFFSSVATPSAFGIWLGIGLVLSTLPVRSTWLL